MHAFIAVALGAVLVGSGVAKALSPAASAAAMGTFGPSQPAARRLLLIGVVVAELGLGVGVALGSRVAAFAAAVLVGAFTVALVVALARGRSGQPCGCFGPRSRVGVGAVVRNVVLAGGLAALPFLDGISFTRQRWTEITAGVALAGVLVLGLLLVALAREVATLRLRVGPQLALDIEGEGPPIGGLHRALRRGDADVDADLVLGVFTSPGCAMCAALAPTLSEIAREPHLLVRTFDEHRDASVWSELSVPGSPYAVAASADGTVRAKGTFNNLAQLESLLRDAVARDLVAHG